MFVCTIVNVIIYSVLVILLHLWLYLRNININVFEITLCFSKALIQCDTYPSPTHPSPAQALFHVIPNSVANCCVETVACVVPEGAALAYHLVLLPYPSCPPTFVKRVPAVTEAAQTRLLL